MGVEICSPATDWGDPSSAFTTPDEPNFFSLAWTRLMRRPPRRPTPHPINFKALGFSAAKEPVRNLHCVPVRGREVCGDPACDHGGDLNEETCMHVMARRWVCEKGSVQKNGCCHKKMLTKSTQKSITGSVIFSANAGSSAAMKPKSRGYLSAWPRHRTERIEIRDETRNGYDTAT